MKQLKIITNPNPILRKKSENVPVAKIVTKEFQELLLNMFDIMISKDGVGLAAPQIGKNIRLAVINTKEGPVYLINAKIVKKSLLKEWGEEGCISIPNVFGEVRRHKSVVCKYVNKEGKNSELKADGLMARVIQHELDHLDGVLFIDTAKNIKTLESKERITRNA